MLAQDPPMGPHLQEEKAKVLPVVYEAQHNCLASSPISGLMVTLLPPSLALATLPSLLLAFTHALLSACITLPPDNCSVLSLKSHLNKTCAEHPMLAPKPTLILFPDLFFSP